MRVKVKFSILVLAVFFLLAGCAGNPYEPKFERPQSSIENEIKDINNFESAEIQWTRIGYLSFGQLYLFLENGDYLSKEEKEMTGKKALRIVFDSIANEANYDGFSVWFIENSTIEGIDGTVVVPIDSTLFTYKLKDLK